MVWLRTNKPPKYDADESYQVNFDTFFDWALTLRNPARQIPEIGDKLNFGIRRHPIGFIAVYLSPRARGLHTLGRTGLARANIYPAGVELQEDIHSHGFDFTAGVAGGMLRNIRHYPDWATKLPEGEGYTGYETSVDTHGQNHTVRATNATISIPQSEVQELEPGAIYSLRPRVDFHSVQAGEAGAVTVFCKTPTYSGQDGLTLILKKPNEDPPPETY